MKISRFYFFSLLVIWAFSFFSLWIVTLITSIDAITINDFYITGALSLVGASFITMKGLSK